MTARELGSKPLSPPRHAETEARGQGTWFDKYSGRAASQTSPLSTHFTPNHLDCTRVTYVAQMTITSSLGMAANSRSTSALRRSKVRR